MMFALLKSKHAAYPKFLIYLFAIYLAILPVHANSKIAESRGNFSVLACITWWSLDAVGYHPAMYLFLENTSGRTITGDEIPFQGRFTDLRNGYVTVAREYKRTPVRNHDRFPLLLRGPDSFELPIDSSLWPAMECKAMYRLNDSNVQNLLITHLSRVTMSDDDAFNQLITQAGRSLQSTTKSNEANYSEIDTTPSPHASLPKSLPGVGSDFYAFDKFYGAAVEYQAAAGSEDLTWTHYHAGTQVIASDAYVGSRNANKADIVILVLNKDVRQKDSDLLLLAKLLIGTKKSQTITPFKHAVRYLSSGRSEIMHTMFGEYKILSFRTAINSDSTNNNSLSKTSVLIASRLPGDLEAMLALYAKRVGFLHTILMHVN